MSLHFIQALEQAAYEQLTAVRENILELEAQVATASAHGTESDLFNSQRTLARSVGQYCERRKPGHVFGIKTFTAYDYVAGLNYGDRHFDERFTVQRALATLEAGIQTYAARTAACRDQQEQLLLAQYDQSILLCIADRTEEAIRLLEDVMQHSCSLDAELQGPDGASARDSADASEDNIFRVPLGTLLAGWYRRADNEAKVKALHEEVYGSQIELGPAMSAKWMDQEAQQERRLRDAHRALANTVLVRRRMCAEADPFLVQAQEALDFVVAQQERVRMVRGLRVEVLHAVPWEPYQATAAENAFLEQRVAERWQPGGGVVRFAALRGLRALC